MSAAPFVIFLPVRNGADYVAQAVGSIVAQTDPDWRLMVLENASTDDTVAIVRGFADPRITIHPAPRPLDMYENWHRPFEMLSAGLGGNPLVTFIGHDDYLYPDFVARMKALADASPGATLFQCMLDLVDGQGGLIRPCKPVPAVESWADMAALMGWGLRDSVGTGYVCRADDYVRVGGMPKLPRILYADHLLFLRLARLGHKRADPMAGCAYRFHEASTSNAVSVGKLNDRLEAFAGFVAMFRNDFPDFTNTDMGRAAMQTWIGRELFVFDGPAVRGVMTPDNRARLAELHRLLESLGGVARPDHWSYQAQPRIVRTLRRARIQLTYLRARLRGG